MKLSDRDKKLILGILLIAIIVLPIFLFIRPKIDAIKGLDTELVTLNERYNYLKDLDTKRPFYESEIARLNEERKDLVKGFAKGILQENTIMFLRDAELSFPINMESFILCIKFKFCSIIIGVHEGEINLKNTDNTLSVSSNLVKILFED